MFLSVVKECFTIKKSYSKKLIIVARLRVKLHFNLTNMPKQLFKMIQMKEKINYKVVAEFWSFSFYFKSNQLKIKQYVTKLYCSK